MTGDTSWLAWARRLAAIAQTGLFYATSHFDSVRYREVRQIAAAMLAAGGAGPEPDVLAILDREAGYATPKVDVRAWCVRDGRLLLVRERADGRWALPGGWAGVDDLPSAAVEREVAEEAGYRVAARRLLACWDRSLQPGARPYPFRVYKLFFACEILGKVPRDESETDALGWFAADDLPPLSLGRVTPGQVARLFTLAADPATPAAFD